MQAFVAHYPAVPISPCRSENRTRSRRRPRAHRDNSYGQSVFFGQRLSPVSVSVASSCAVSETAPRNDGFIVLCARAPDEGSEKEGAKGQEKRWWFFGKHAKVDARSEKEPEPFVKAVVETRHVEEDRDAHSSTSEHIEKSASTETQGRFAAFVAKLMELRKPSDETKNSSAHVEKVNDGLQKLKEMETKQQDVSKTLKNVEAKTTDDIDPWTQFLNVIVPNRKKQDATVDSKVNASPEVKLEKSKLRTEDDTMEAKSSASTTSPNPLDRFRSTRELHLSPKSSEEKKSSSDKVAIETSKNDEQVRGNLIAKLLPWLNSESDTEKRKKGEKEQILPTLPQKEAEDRTARSIGEDSDGTTAVMVKSKVVDSSSSKTSKKKNGTVPSSESASEDKGKTPVGSATSSRSKEKGNSASKQGAAGSSANGTPAVEVFPQKDVAEIRLIFGSETFFATETVAHPGGLIFRGNLRGEPKATLAKLEKRLHARLGDKYTLCLAEGEDDLRPVVVIVPTARDKRPSTTRQKAFALAIGLITLTTCLARGAYANLHSNVIRNAYGTPINPSFIEEVFMIWPVTAMGLSIACIVLLSQIVQRIVAARRKTRLALPYLIPSYQLGSFGAVVQLASPTPSRAALFDIAFSGALTLLLVSLGLLIVGLILSTSFPSVIPVPMSMVSSSMLIGALTTFVPNGNILVDYGKSLIGLHPLAVIGANCLTIAALNLLPIRQLDGGRIVFAIYGRKTAVLASRVTIFFLLLASTKVPFYFVFLAAITFGPWSLDRPAKNELTEPNGARAILGYLLLLAMVGILLPHPASKFFGTA